MDVVVVIHCAEFNELLHFDYHLQFLFWLRWVQMNGFDQFRFLFFCVFAFWMLSDEKMFLSYFIVLLC